jgi:hypothetical protein
MGFLAYGVFRVPVQLVCVSPLYVFVFLDYGRQCPYFLDRFTFLITHIGPVIGRVPQFLFWLNPTGLLLRRKDWIRKVKHQLHEV